MIIINIGFLVGDISLFGGIERVVTTIANHLEKNEKYHIKIISLYKPKNKEIQFELDEKIEVIYLNYESNSFHSYRSCFDMFKFLYKNLSTIDIDTIVCLDTYQNIYLSILKRFLKIKVIAWHHEDYFNDTSKWNQLKRLFYPRLDGVVLLTQRDLDEYQKFYKNAIVISNPTPFKCEYLFNKNSKTILSLGRLSVEKSFQYLIKAFSELKDEFKDWKVEIVGEGAEKEFLSNLISELKLEDQVYITPFTSNVKEKYMAAAFTVLTSQKEGLPMMLIESKAFGIPSISFDVRTGPREIIEDKIDGILIEPNELSQLVSAMRELMTNDEKRLQYSYNAINNAQRYEIDSIIECWNKLLEKI